MENKFDQGKHKFTPTDLDALIEASAKTMKVSEGEENKPIFWCTHTSERGRSWHR
jgi:hypothetical protein